MINFMSFKFIIKVLTSKLKLLLNGYFYVIFIVIIGKIKKGD